MLLQLLRCNGAELLVYKDRILTVLCKILGLQCVQGYEIAGKSLMYLLRSLSLTYPLSYRSVPGDLDRPVKEYLAIRVGHSFTVLQTKHNCSRKTKLCLHILTHLNKDQVVFIVKLIGVDNIEMCQKIDSRQDLAH